MNVELFGHTVFHLPKRVNGTEFGKRVNTYDSLVVGGHSGLVAETAGRTCFDSFHLPNPATSTNAGYLANIQRQHHDSVMEHGMATFMVTGVSRSLLMEFRTHRHLTFSARSTRYVDERDAQMVVPPALQPHLDRPLGDSDFSAGEEIDDLMGHATSLYERVVEFLMADGAGRKEAREAAREFLPGATVTEFVVSGNHRAWREVLPKRYADGAAKEIRALAKELLRQLKELEPAIYQDVEVP
ncbi:FAD-dependent thymidylate synthase [Streptomyces luteogriseus]|uniref:FAD-dependent thymidylate synthase n=1 Tax=Streptomyces luteogriseus TaxID=68233 RepID=UPI0037BE1F6E